jgi:hypothetical protein
MIAQNTRREIFGSSRMALYISAILIVSSVQMAFPQSVAIRSLLPRPQQLPVDQVSRDAKGTELFQNAISALGGTAAINAAQGEVVVGTYSGPVGSGQFKWLDEGWEFRADYKGANSPTWTNTILSGHGSGRVSAIDKNYVITQKARLEHLPYANLGSRLIQILNLKDSSVGPPQITVLSGKSVLSVEVHVGLGVTDSSLTKQMWYFDATTNMPVAVDFYETDAFRKNRGSMMRAELAGYHLSAGIYTPQSVDLSTAGGTMVAHYQIDNITFNQMPDNSVFDQK